MDQIYKFVTENQDHYVRLLAEAVKIRRLFLLIYSVSASKEMRPEVVKMCNWIETQLTRLGVSYELRLPGNQMVDGETLKLPPIILARYGTDSKKKTVLVYGHYDVQPALKEDGWATDPWVLTEDSQGRMFGRGSTDDKGPVISWMWVLLIIKRIR
jgi:Cys-Gly metallodipeptidase DUG1